jgi:WD40 repeat protein
MFNYFRWLFYLYLMLIGTQAAAVVSNNAFGHSILTDNLSAKVTSLTSNVNNGLLVAGLEDGNMTVWDMNNQTVYASALVAAAYSVEQVKFSPDGSILVAGYVPEPARYQNISPHHIKIWDVAEKQLLAEFSNVYFPIAFSPDSSHLAFYQDGKVVVLNTVARTLEHEFAIELVKYPNMSSGVFNSVVYKSNSVLTFSHDNQLLAGSQSNGGLMVWNIDTGEKIAQLGEFAGSAIAMSPDKKTLLSASYNSIYLWDLATQTSTQIISDHPDYSIYHVQFSPDGQHFISQSINGHALLWDIASKTSTELTTFPDWFTPSSNIAYSHDGRFKLTNHNTVLYIQDRLSSDVVVKLLDGDYASSVMFTPNGKFIAGMNDNSLHIWDSTQFTTVKQTFSDISTAFQSLRFFKFAQINPLQSGWVDLLEGQFHRLLSSEELIPFNQEKWFELDDWLVVYGLNDEIRWTGMLSDSTTYDTNRTTTVNQLLNDKNTLPAADITPDGNLIATAVDNKVQLSNGEKLIAEWEIVSSEPVQYGVFYVKLSADGKRLMAVHYVGKQHTVYSPATITFWDVASQTKLSEIPPESDNFTVFGTSAEGQFSPDNKVFLFNHGNDVLVLEVETGQTLFEIRGIRHGGHFIPSPRLYNATFTDDNTLIFDYYFPIAYYSPVVTDETLLEGVELSEADTLTFIGRYQNGSYQVDKISATLIGDKNLFLDAQTLISGNNRNPETHLWDMTTLSKQTIPAQYVTHYEQTLVTRYEVEEDYMLQVWDGKTLSKVAQANGIYGDVNENLVAYTDNNCIAYVYDLAQRQPVMQTKQAVLDECDSRIGAVLSADKRFLITSRSGASPRIWRIATSEQVFYAQDTYYGFINKNNFSADDSVLAYPTLSNRLRLLDTATFTSVPQFAKLTTDAAHIAPNHQIAAHAQQPILAIMNSDLTQDGIRNWDGIKLWHVETGDTFGYQNSSKLYSVAWHPQQAILAYSDYAGQIHLWNSDTNTTIGLNNPHPAYFMAWHPDTTQIAASSDDNLVIVWDVATGTEITRLAHDAPVRQLQWSTDGLATAAGSTIYLWNGATARQIHTAQPISRLDFNADNSIIVSLGTDIVFWDVATGEQLDIIQDNQIIAIATHSSQNLLAYATITGEVKLYDFDKKQQVAELNHYNYPVVDLAFGGDNLIVDARKIGTLDKYDVQTEPDAQQVVQTWSLDELIR